MTSPTSRQLFLTLPLVFSVLASFALYSSSSFASSSPVDDEASSSSGARPRPSVVRGRPVRGWRRRNCDVAGGRESGAVNVIDLKPIKDSIDELQSVVIQQNSQGHKEMMRAFLVMYRQMSKWHKNMTNEIRNLIELSQRADRGITDLRGDVGNIGRRLKKLAEEREEAASRAADFLDLKWVDDDDGVGADDELAIFEAEDEPNDFARLVGRNVVESRPSKVGVEMEKGEAVLSSSQLDKKASTAEIPTSRSKKLHTPVYEWMPDKHYASRHREDKKTARELEILASTRRLEAGLSPRVNHQTPSVEGLRRAAKIPAMESNEVVDSAETREIRRSVKAEALAKEFLRKKEERRKSMERTRVGQVQGDITAVARFESRVARGNAARLSEARKKRLMKPFGDCSELSWRWRQEGLTPKDGIYAIRPRGCATFLVYCEFDRDGSGWTVIQRREDGSVDFARDWKDYREGFGDLDGEFWLGNYGIDCVTNQGGSYSLRVDVDKWDDDNNNNGGHYWSEYADFRIEDEANNYVLHVQGYNENSTAGDSLMHQGDFNADQRHYHDHIPFSTKDRDNDRFRQGNCAVVVTGGWWFNACHFSNLNGKYYEYKGEKSLEHADGLTWLSLTNNWYSLKGSSMKIKANYRRS